MACVIQTLKYLKSTSEVDAMPSLCYMLCPPLPLTVKLLHALGVAA